MGLECAGPADLARSLDEALRRDDRALKFYDFGGLAHSETRPQFGDQVRRLTQELKALGVGPGVVVAVMGTTSPELCHLCAAIWSAQGVLTVLATPTRLGSFEEFLNQTLGKLTASGAELLVGDPSVVEGFKDVAACPVVGWDSLQSVTFQAKAGDSRLLEQGVSLIQFSSGTTREPQPIMLSARALLANSRAVLDKFPGGAQSQTSVSWLPLYHDMGLIGGFLMPLLGGAQMVLMGPEVFAARPLTWLEAISKERGTTSSAPNFALAHCANRIDDDAVQALDLSSWAIAMVGAEAVRPTTLRGFAERFAEAGFRESAFSPVYGLAEATLAVTFSPLGEGLKTLSLDDGALSSCGQVVSGGRESPSLGRPLDGVQVAIRADGQNLPEDRLGEVFVKGPSLFSGYLGEAGRPRALGADGWLDTGDMGFLHEGELHLYGRRRDILLLDGRNHDPSLLEEAMETIPCLRRCCAFTQESQTTDKDELIAVCEVALSFEGDLNELRERIVTACHQGAGLIPNAVVLVRSGSLPSTSSGKLRRIESSKAYRSDALDLLVGEPVSP